MRNGSTGSGIPLPQMNVGERGIIAHLANTDAEAFREFRAMGLERGVPIRLVDSSSQLVIRQGSREITLSKRLSRAIHIRTKLAARYW
jgi:Fe2+ transport system protein FeoA